MSRTENVNIVIRESGAAVVKRKIDEIGVAANSATRGIFLLERALFVLGGAGLLSGLARLADSLTNVENRLRLTTSSTANLEAVQDALFDSANRSRSAFESTAEVYSRIALSTRQLGVSQQQVIAVTETLQKAAALSGAGAQEANAALIQLGQGLASDRLGGDELRSILEQLPLVADILVDYLNQTQQFGTVTRGTLRELGSEGKLTADIIFSAIEASQGKINDLFAQTQPTIEQGFVVAKNNLLELIDTIDDATGASAKVAQAIIFIGENLDKIAIAVGAVGIAFTASLATTAIKTVAALISKIIALGGATAAAAASEAQTAAAMAATTRARQLRIAQITQQIAANQGVIAQNLILRQQEFQEAAAALGNGRARDIQTGQFISNAAARERLIAASARLTAAETASAASAARLTAARTALIAADNAAAGAQTRLAAASAAQATVASRLSATFPLLTGVAVAARTAIGGLFALLLANPITAVIAAVLALVAAFFIWGDQIAVTADGVVSLKEFVVAAFQLMQEAIAPFLGPIWEGIKTAASGVGNFIKNVFSTVGGAILSAVTTLINAVTLPGRLVIATVSGIIAAWDQLPNAAGEAVDQVVDFFVTGFENIVNFVIGAINKIIGAINGLASKVEGTALGDALGIKQIAEIPAATFDNLRTNFGNAGGTAAESFTEAFTSSLDSTRIENIVGGLTNTIIERARANSAAAVAEQKDADLGSVPGAIPGTPSPDSGGSKGGGNEANFASELARLQQQIELEKQYGLQKEITNNILAIEKTLKRELTDTEIQQIANATQLLEISKIQGQVLEEVLGPQEKLILGQTALNELFLQGKINLEQYNAQLRQLQINADLASGTIGGGFRAAISGAIMSATQFGEAMGNVVLGGINSAADAIVEFAKTGKLSLRDLFAELFANLLRLAAQQLLLRLIGPLLGIPITGFSGGGSILPSFAGGGTIMPSGVGSTDSQIVQFAKRPDERVDILTPEQQMLQRNGQGNGSGTTVVQSPPVNVAAVLSPSDIVGAFDSSDGETVVINILSRNASSVRQILG